jgi:signal transduction histidine kinase
MVEIRLFKGKLFLNLFKLLAIAIISFSTNHAIASIKPITIDNHIVDLEDFSIGYYHDKDNNLSINEVKKLNFKPITSQTSTGILNLSTWYKLKISNQSRVLKKLFLHNNLAYMSKQIDIFEFHAQQQIDQNKYLFLDKDIGKILNGSTLVYPISIQANSVVTIYIKNQAIIHQLIDLSLHNQHASIQSLINKSFYSNIIISILFAIGFYNLMLFFYSKQKEFLLYSIYLINVAIGLFYMYGSLFNNLNIYGSSAYWFNLTAIFVSLFLALFVKSIFNTKQTSRKINTLLNFIISICLLDTLFALIVDLALAIQTIHYIFILSFFVLIYIGIFYYKKKHPLALTFLFAYSFYTISFLITLTMLLGLIPYNFFTFHASGFGLILEAFVFSYLIHSHIKILQEEILQQKNTLILKHKKSQMGDMFGAITHQWKQPLTAISSVIMLLQYRLDSHSSLPSTEIRPKLKVINEKVSFLIETINDFRYFFNPKRELEECDIDKIIDKAVSLSYDDMLSANISIKTDYHFKSSIKIYPNELLHILLNILQNSKEAFEKKALLINRQASNTNSNNLNTLNLEDEINIIKIVGYTKHEQIIIDIIDNAGGINKKNIAHIFDEFYTTKEKTKGSGIGLYLTKFILEKHMNGTIEALSINNGIVFRIII